jgi:Ca-activated chloride channel family protein
MTALDLTLVPHTSGIAAGSAGTMDVLVRVRAPAQPEEARLAAPRNLALVIDRSGSMEGRPLQEAKRCLTQIVDQLPAADQVSLVAYGHHAALLSPLVPAAQKDGLKLQIAVIEAGGGTALYDGWHMGATSLGALAGSGALARVLLLSDGNANRGPSKPDALAAACARLAAEGITTSTYGLGREFNEELMSRMAEAGQGTAYYGETAEDLIDPMQQELDLLSALCARRLRLTFEGLNGATATLVNRYPVIDGRHVLPDIAWASDATAVIRLHIPEAAHSAAPGGALPVLKVDLAYEPMEGSKHSQVWARLDLDVLGAAEAEALVADPQVSRRVMELAIAELQFAARHAARHSDWNRVKRLLDDARALARDNPWALSAVDVLEGLARRRDADGFGKEAYYRGRRMNSRLSAPDEASVWDEASERLRPSFLGRKREEGKRRP